MSNEFTKVLIFPYGSMFGKDDLKNRPLKLLGNCLLSYIKLSVLSVDDTNVGFIVLASDK